MSLSTLCSLPNEVLELIGKYLLPDRCAGLPRIWNLQMVLDDALPDLGSRICPPRPLFTSQREAKRYNSLQLRDLSHSQRVCKRLHFVFRRILYKAGQLYMDENFRSGYHRAVSQGNVAAVDLFLRYGANPDEIPEPNLEEKALLKSSGDFNEGRYPRCMLAEAAFHGHLDVARVLLTSNVCIDGPRRHIGWNTPLQHAVENGKAHIATFLVDEGADVMTTTFTGETLLHELVARSGFPTSSGRFFRLERRIDMYAGKDIIEFAGFVKMLSVKFPRIMNTLSHKGYTALHYANSVDVARLLLDCGTDIDAHNGSGITTLAKFMVERHNLSKDGIILCLIDRGARTDIPIIAGGRRTTLRSTVLHEAALRGSDFVLAIASKATPRELDMQDINGDTALHISACVMGCRPLVREIKESGRYVTTLAETYMSQADNVETLIKCGARVDVRNNLGETALHRAIRETTNVYEMQVMPVIVNILLTAGAEIDARNYNGETALHLASYYGAIETFRTLVRAGAEKYAQDASGQTPMDVLRGVYSAEDPHFRDFLDDVGGSQELILPFPLMCPYYRRFPRTKLSAAIRKFDRVRE